MNDSESSRRRFVKFCATGLAAAGVGTRVSAQPDPLHHEYQRVQLTDELGNALKTDQLEVGVNYLFHYPYVSTPCFLLDLGKTARSVEGLETESKEAYFWPGGVGPKRSVVAFSAICTHKLSHPARSVSFISYRHENVQYWNKNYAARVRDQVIYCCSEKSVYDPGDGARVLGGPAPQPLATIVLEIDANDQLYATGTLGGEVFERFFERFEHRLQLEYKVDDVRALVNETSPTVRITDFSASRMLCGALS